MTNTHGAGSPEGARRATGGEAGRVERGGSHRAARWKRYCGCYGVRQADEGVGSPAHEGHTDLQATHAAADAGAHPAGAEEGRAVARPQGPRRHDHHPQAG